MAESANAFPTKRFFLDMLPRDISLEDALLDLIDNPIDSLTRTQEIDFIENPFVLLDAKPSEDAQSNNTRPKIKLELQEDEVSIVDDCGGIDFESAKNDVFRLGRVIPDDKAYLSVYGIGLKRALFKLGRDIFIESWTQNSGFRIQIDVEEWAENEDDWEIPIERLPGAKKGEVPGTRIVVSRLNSEVSTRIKDPGLGQRLQDYVGQTYSLFLDNYVDISINERRIEPHRIPIGSSNEIQPATEQYDDDGVHVTIVAGLGERGAQRWYLDKAGWYVLCNGRVIVFADKTDLTGWGNHLPQFHSKYSGFLGIVFFFSENPEELPWTTTKRGLHRESLVFQRAQGRMVIAARPVLKFLSEMYPSDTSGDLAEPAEREMAAQLRAADLGTVARQKSASFQVKRQRRHRPTSTSVQYKVKKEELERAKACLGKPSWSATQVGKYTFEYFLDQECSE